MPGRLKKPKKRTVMVRFNEEQYAKLQEVADAAELPVAVYCRAMVVKAVGRGDVEPPIRGNVSRYVDEKQRPRAETLSRCPVHPDQTLFVTQDGLACSLCTNAGNGRESKPSRRVRRAVDAAKRRKRIRGPSPAPAAPRAGRKGNFRRAAA